MKSGSLLAFSLLSTIAALAANGQSPTRASAGEAARLHRASAQLLEQPFHFEALPPSGAVERYSAAGPGYGMELTPAGVSVVLVHGQAGTGAGAAPEALQLKMTLLGANESATAEPLDKATSVSNYILGNDASAWRMGVAQYQRLRFTGIYPGIDVVYYGNGGRLEHDFVVQPGAAPARIQMRFPQERPSIDSAGDLVLAQDGGGIRLLKPVAYQPAAKTPSQRDSVDVQYRIAANGDVSFALGNYDRTRPLVIDPVLSLSTYIGSFNDVINGVALDAAGEIYVTGEAYAAFGLTTKNPVLTAGTGTYNAFIAKLKADGSGLIFSTYIGGNKVDSANGIALDGNGNAYIAGKTSSTTFPTMAAAQATLGVSSCYSSFVTCYNGFVTAIKADGSALIYSTYLGGSVNDQVNSIAADSSGDAYVTGSAQSPSFPKLNAYQASFDGGGTCSAGSCGDAFVTKLSPAGALVFSTFLGNTGNNIGNGIALDGSNNIYITGQGNYDFPQASKLLFNGSNLSVTSGAFITKMAANGASLVYSDVVPGGKGTAIAVDSGGAAYVTGVTGGATTFPVTTGAYSSTKSEIWAFKLLADGSAFAYSTYIGGNNNASNLDASTAIAVDGSLNAWVTGFTETATFPTASPIQSMVGGLFDISADGGTTFSVSNSGLLGTPTAILLDPANPGTLLVSDGGLYISTNRGQTWTAVATTGLTSTSISSLQRSISSSTTLYAMTPSGLFRSLNNGVAWTLQAGTGLPSLVGTSLTVAVDPANASLIYSSQASVGQPFVFSSSNGGSTWTSVSTGLPASGNISFLIADPKNSGTVLAGIGTKVYRTTNGGASWTASSTTLPSQMIALSLDPENPSTVYAGTVFSGYYVSTDGGNTFTAGNSQFSFYATGIIVDPSNSNTIYAIRTQAPYWAIYKSTNGGSTFTATPFVNSSPTLLTIDPAYNNYLYVPTTPTETAFVTQIKPDGSGLLFSTFLDGIGNSEFWGMALDSSGLPVLGGFTDATNFPTTNSGVRPSVSGGIASPEIARPLDDPNPPTGTSSGGIGTTSGTVVHLTNNAAALTLTETITPSLVATNGTPTYAFHITNTSSTVTATNVLFSWIPATGSLTNLSNLTTIGFACTPGPAAVTCTMPSLAPSSSAYVNVTPTAPVLGVFTDSSYVEATDSYEVTASGTLTVANTADLGVVVSLPAFIAGGVQFGSEVVVTNAGPATAVAPNFTFSVDSGLTGLGYNTVDNGLGTFFCENAPTYTPGLVNATSISCKLKDLPSGQSVTWYGIMTAANTGAVTGTATATVSSSTPDPNSANNTNSAGISIFPPSADLQARTPSEYTNEYKGSLHPIFAVDINNLGPNTAENVVVTISLGSGLTSEGGGPPCCGCDHGTYSGLGTATVTCSTPALSQGQRLHLYFTLNPLAIGTFPVNVSVASATGDPNPSNNTSSSNFTLTGTLSSFAWIVNANGTVSTLDGSGHPRTIGPAHPRISPITSGGGLTSGTTAAAIDSSGDVWLAGTASVAEFNSSGNVLSGSGYTGGGLGASGSSSTGIAIDGVSSVWVSNSNGSVTWLSNSGVPLSPSTGFTGGGLSAPSSVAVDNAGTVWVTNSGNNSVTRIFGGGVPTTTPLATAQSILTLGSQP